MTAFSLRPHLARVLLLGIAATGIAGAAPDMAGAFGGNKPAKTYACPKGKAWNGKHCVRVSLLDDGTLIEQGRQLAVTGHYAEAIDMLKAVSDKHDPLALTYLGYSYRKSGELSRGMALYRQALAIDPNNLRTREYLGEGYVQSGHIDLARLQLAKVKTLCGSRTCPEYHALAEAIEDAGGSY